jgi:glutamyl-tRNA synthetase/nondiscriminating glutamyl-tRNA synthetase
MGYLPEAMVNYQALLGWGAPDGRTEIFSLPELTAMFSLERVTPSPAAFDFEKLNWLNRHYLRQLDPARLVTLAWPCFAARLGAIEAAPEARREWFRQLVALFLPSIDHLDQLAERAGFGFSPPAAGPGLDAGARALLATDTAHKVIAAFSSRVRAAEGPVSAEQFRAWMNEVKAETGARGKDLFHPVRILLTGSHSGPEFDRLIPLLEEGAALGIGVAGVRERVEAFSAP